MPKDKRDQQELFIQRPDGSLVRMNATEESLTTVPGGPLEYRKSEVRVMTLDGAVLRPGEVAYMCTVCNTGPWHLLAMRQCTKCPRRICAQTCAKEGSEGGILCAECAQKEERKSRKKFWFGI